MNNDSTTRQLWYHIDDVEKVDSPAFVVFPERVRSNIKAAIKVAGNAARLRPHVKTPKAKEPVLLMIEEGIDKFKCATIAEAEMLGMCKANDVLLAYQPVGPKVNRLIELVKCYPGTRFSCLVDNTTAAVEISNTAVAHQLRMPVYLDLNVGMNRTGIEPGKAFALYMECISLPGIQPVGLHVYDGHIHHPSIEQRTIDCEKSFAPVEALKQQIIVHGFEEPVVIAGGTPTFPVHCQREKVECCPGTFVYWDENYEKSCPEQPFQVAAVVITRVVSLPSSATVCVDLGHKSIASENDLHHRVSFLNVPGLQVTGHSEEHLVLQAEKECLLKPGDLLYGVPFHVCPTVALYERAITVENHKITGEWKTIARDRKLNY